MNGWLTVSLEDLRFFSFHGAYVEEKIVGNEYSITLEVKYEPASGMITDLSDTIDYAAVYDLVREEMDRPNDLLETLAMTIVGRIHEKFRTARHASIRICKLNAPFKTHSGHACVTYSNDF